MGIEMKPTSFRFDAVTLRKIDELLALFAPLTTKRSHVLRIVVDVVHGWLSMQGVVFTPGTLQALAGSLLGLLRTTSYDKSPFELPARLPVAREASLDVQAGQEPRVVPISRLSRAHAVLELEAWPTSFLGLCPDLLRRRIA